MQQRSKPKSLRKLIRERAFDSGDLQLACAERNLRILLAVWMAVRMLTSAALLIATQNWLQLLAAALCLIFAGMLYLSKIVAIVALLGGLATLWQVFNCGFFDIASRLNSPLHYALAALLLLTGALQTISMGYILLSKRLAPYFSFVLHIRDEWIAQAQAYRRQQKGGQAPVDETQL